MTWRREEIQRGRAMIQINKYPVFFGPQGRPYDPGIGKEATILPAGRSGPSCPPRRKPTHRPFYKAVVVSRLTWERLKGRSDCLTKACAAPKIFGPGGTQTATIIPLHSLLVGGGVKLLRSSGLGERVSAASFACGTFFSGGPLISKILTNPFADKKKSFQAFEVFPGQLVASQVSSRPSRIALAL